MNLIGPPPLPPTGRKPVTCIGSTLRHFGGRCLAINANNQLYLTSGDCNVRLTEINGGILEVFDYNRCVDIGRDGYLELQNFCSTKFQKINIGNDGYFMLHKVKVY